MKHRQMLSSLLMLSHLLMFAPVNAKQRCASHDGEDNKDIVMGLMFVLTCILGIFLYRVLIDNDKELQKKEKLVETLSEKLVNVNKEKLEIASKRFPNNDTKTKQCDQELVKKVNAANIKKLELEETIDKRDKTIIDLEEKIKKLNTTLSQIKRNLENTTRNKEELPRVICEIHRANTLLNKTKDQHSKSQDELRPKKKELKKLEGTIKTLQAKVGEEQASIKYINKTIKENSYTIEKLEKKLKSSKKELESSKKELESSKKELEGREEEGRRLTVELKETKAKFQEKQKELETKNKKSQNDMAELEKLKEAIQGIEQQISGIPLPQVSFDTLQQLLEQLKASIKKQKEYEERLKEVPIECLQDIDVRVNLSPGETCNDTGKKIKDSGLCLKLQCHSPCLSLVVNLNSSLPPVDFSFVPSNKKNELSLDWTNSSCVHALCCSKVQGDFSIISLDGNVTDSSIENYDEKLRHAATAIKKFLTENEIHFEKFIIYGSFVAKMQTGDCCSANIFYLNPAKYNISSFGNGTLYSTRLPLKRVIKDALTLIKHIQKDPFVATIDMSALFCLHYIVGTYCQKDSAKFEFAPNIFIDIDALRRSLESYILCYDRPLPEQAEYNLPKQQGNGQLQYPSM